MNTNEREGLPTREQIDAVVAPVMQELELDILRHVQAALDKGFENGATRMRDLCVGAVKAALADARRSWPASRATTEYELGARGAFTAALSAIESLTLEAAANSVPGEGEGVEDDEV